MFRATYSNIIFILNLQNISQQKPILMLGPNPIDKFNP